MKKILLLLLIAALGLGFVGCSEDEDTTPIGDDDDDDDDTASDEGGDFLLCDGEEALTEETEANSAACWDECYGCAITAANEETGDKEGACYEVYAACMADAACTALLGCLSPDCDSVDDWEACYEECVAEHGGAELNGALDTCILCEGCPNKCAFAAMPEDCEQ